MHLKIVRFVGVLLVVMLAVAVVVPLQAASGGTITISDAPTGQSPESCDRVELGYHFTFTANTDDGGGSDWVAIVMTDGNGKAIDTDFFAYSLGAVDDTNTYDGNNPDAITARPITFSLYDITDPGSINENTIAGHNFGASGTLLAQTTFDPGRLTVNGTCENLPFAGAASCLAIPAGAVVGDLPFSTQAYWAPGKQANGVVINPGTYWVFGKDQSGKFYEIMLSCQNLWVPVGNMQPSFQPPQNGQPLPTQVVG